MKMILKLSKEAARYKGYYVGAILATLCLTMVNLAAPRILSKATGIISSGVGDKLSQMNQCALILLGLYLGRVLFRFLNNYLAHKAAWELVGDLRQRLYEKLQVGQQEQESASMRDVNNRQVVAMLRALRASAIFHPTVEFISSIGTVLVVFFGGYLAYHNGLSVEDILSFILYLSLFYAPVSGLAQLLENLQQALS